MLKPNTEVNMKFLLIPAIHQAHTDTALQPAEYKVGMYYSRNATDEVHRFTFNPHKYNALLSSVKCQ